VIQAGVMGQGGEIFVLDMGQPVKIVDLARDLIELSGLIPGEDIDIVFTGLRPGEQLTECLFSTDETIRPTSHPKISAIAKTTREDHLPIRKAVVTLKEAVARQDEAQLYHILADLLPNAKLQTPARVTKSVDGFINLL
jgi:FlaA1/EpsC-like NDP-sugar epimerase